MPSGGISLWKGWHITVLISITNYESICPEKLMSLYAEGNMENIDYFYPEIEDKKLALEKVEEDFLHYIKTDFFSRPENTYWVLEDNGVWVSALRLYKIEDGLYYIEALETHPDYRRKGFASTLLAGVIGELKKQGSFRLCDSVSKKNTASIKTHEKCGFRVVSHEAYNYLSGKSSEKSFGMEFSFKPSHSQD